MLLKDWIEKRKAQQIAARDSEVKINDSIGKLWVKCYNCNAQIPKKEIEANLMVCPHCDYHFRIDAITRLIQLVDEDSFEELFKDVLPTDPLEFFDTEKYTDRLKKAQARSGMDEAVITGIGKINDEEVAIAVMDFDYMGGSMGSVVGEKITRLIEEAIKRQLPVIAVTASGGARMQESCLSLMQMAKTSCAVSRLNEEKLLYITVLTEPTFGGVTASFCTIGDIIIAEQDARIGFAGRRVIEQTIRQKLPSNFQTADYLMNYGQVDIVASRYELKSTLTKLLKLHKKEKRG